MKHQTKLLLIYIFSFILSILSAFLYYENIYGADFGFNVSVLAIVVVPCICLVLSIIFDKVAFKMEINNESIIASLLFLPLFISSHFIILTIGNMKIFSEAVSLWYFSLYLPILVLIIFAYFAYKYSKSYLKLFIIIKYVLSIILYGYGFLIFFVYSLSGSSV